MATNSILDHRVYGDGILAKLGSPPARLKPFVKRFADVHKRFDAACAVVEKAKAARDEALQRVGTADAVQDASVDALAVALVGAKITQLDKPFSTFSRYSPSILKTLAYRVEAEEIRALAAKVAAKKPPASIKSVLAKCTKSADGVIVAIKSMAAPQATYQKALAARDALLPEWTLELHRLKREAAAAWVDSPGTYRATFGAPEKVAAPKKRRAAKKKPPTATPPTAPAPTTPTP